MTLSASKAPGYRLQLDYPPLLDLDAKVWVVSHNDDPSEVDKDLSIFQARIARRTLWPSVRYVMQYVDEVYAELPYESQVHPERFFPAGWNPQQDIPYDQQPEIAAKFARCRSAAVLPKKIPPLPCLPGFVLAQCSTEPFSDDPRCCNCDDGLVVPSELTAALERHGLTLEISNRSTFRRLLPSLKAVFKTAGLIQEGVGHCHILQLQSPQHDPSSRCGPHAATAVLRHVAANTASAAVQLLCADGGGILVRVLLAVIAAIFSIVHPHIHTMVYPIEADFVPFALQFGFARHVDLKDPHYAPRDVPPPHWALSQNAGGTRALMENLFYVVDCNAFVDLLRDLGPSGVLAGALAASTSVDCSGASSGSNVVKDSSAASTGATGTSSVVGSPLQPADPRGTASSSPLSAVAPASSCPGAGASPSSAASPSMSATALYGLRAFLQSLKPEPTKAKTNPKPKQKRPAAEVKPLVKVRRARPRSLSPATKACRRRIAKIPVPAREYHAQHGLTLAQCMGPKPLYLQPTANTELLLTDVEQEALRAALAARRV